MTAMPDRFPPLPGQVSEGPLPAFDANRFPLEPGVRLLEASAGTGKTFALAHLVLRLITEPRQGGYLRLGQLLVVTFTNAAAAELRDRIARRLQQGLRCLAPALLPVPDPTAVAVAVAASDSDRPATAPDAALAGWLAGLPEDLEQRDRLRGQLLLALEDLDSADITTIHGFCSRTLQRQALEAAQAPDLRLETDAGTLRQELCHDYWHGQVLSLPPHLLAGLQKRGLNADRLADVLRSLDADPALTVDPLPEGLRIDGPLAEQLEALWLTPWRRFVALWQEQGAALEQSLRQIAKRWRQEGVPAKETAPYAAAPRSDRQALLSQWLSQQPLEGSYAAVLEQDKLLGTYFHSGGFCKVARPIEQPDRGDPSLPDPALMAAVADVVDGPAERLLLHFCHWAMPELARRREQRGSIGFSQLLEALDPGDGEHPPANPQAEALLEAVGRRYAVALIDEFQDTDPIQWRILKRSFFQGGEHLLVMVGDPKQAIYRFRGGDLATYRAARALCDTIVGLDVNFRSSAVLLSQLNRLMDPGLRRSRLEVPAVSPPAEAPGSRPSLGLPAGESPLQLLWFGPERAAGDPLPSLSSIEADLPDALAGWVDGLLARRLVLESKGRCLGPGDLCLLVSRHQQADALRQALERRGLASRLVSTGDVLTSEGATALQRFLDVLADPGDGNRLRLLAASPLLAWSASRIAATTPLEWNALAGRLGGLASQLASLGLLGALNQMLQMDGLARLTLRGRLLADLQQAAALVQERIHGETLGPRAAADWLRRRRLDPDLDPPDTHQPNSDAVDEAISVVTVHRSKGLEYPVVICPYLWQAPSQRSRGLGIRWMPPGSAGPRLDLHLSAHWGHGRQAAEQDLDAQEQERERLAYVAATRAQVLLVFCYAQVAGHDCNPLLPWLFGPDSRVGAGDGPGRGSEGQVADGSAGWRGFLELRAQRLELDLTLTLLPAAADQESTAALQPPAPAPLPELDPRPELACGPVPSWPLDCSWGRSSYSGWTHRQGPAPAPDALEEGRDRDAQVGPLALTAEEDPDGPPAGEAELPPLLQVDGPLASFPRGAAAGDCLHRILERIDFQLPGDHPDTRRVVERELQRAGVASDLVNAVGEGLDRVRLTPFGGGLGAFHLACLSPVQRLAELTFDLPLAASSGQLVRARDLAKVFREHPGGAFGAAYASSLEGLPVASRGFLTGSIDLVFRAADPEGQDRWWVVDWKSNWIGERDGQGQPLACAPRHYHQAALERAMAEHHYPLQAHLYLVALHRYLNWRLPGYIPERDLGGYGYLFLRGLPGPLPMTGAGGAIPGLVLERPPLDRILALDALLREGAP